MKNKKVGFYLLVAVLFIAGSSLHGMDKDGKKKKLSFKGETPESPGSPRISAIMQKRDMWAEEGRVFKGEAKSPVAPNSTFREFKKKYETSKKRGGDQFNKLKKAQIRDASKEDFARLYADTKEQDNEETLGAALKERENGKDLYTLVPPNSPTSDELSAISERSEDSGEEADEEESEEEGGQEGEEITEL